LIHHADVLFAALPADITRTAAGPLAAAVRSTFPINTATAVLILAAMFDLMTPQVWVDSWDKALKGFPNLPAAWAAAGSSSNAGNGHSSTCSTTQEMPQAQKLLPHLLTSAQEGVDIPMTAWRKLVVTDEVRQ
jgi:hypothetical protein